MLIVLVILCQKQEEKEEMIKGKKKINFCNFQKNMFEVKGGLLNPPCLANKMLVQQKRPKRSRLAAYCIVDSSYFAQAK